MAQPVFDGHPLEDYFQGMFLFTILFCHLTCAFHAADSGEASELMPGGITDFPLQPFFTGHPSISKHSERMERLCYLIFGAVEVSTHTLFLQPLSTQVPIFIPMSLTPFGRPCYHNVMQSLSSFHHSSRTSQRIQAFAERFKYGVISSSLLSPAFSAAPMAESHRRGSSLTLPGNLFNTHSRTPSAAESTGTDNLSLSMPPEPETPLWPITLSFTVAIAALSARFYFFALLSLATTMYYMHVHRLDMHSKPDVMTPVSHLSLSLGWSTNVM